VAPRQGDPVEPDGCCREVGRERRAQRRSTASGRRPSRGRLRKAVGDRRECVELRVEDAQPRMREAEMPARPGDGHGIGEATVACPGIESVEQRMYSAAAEVAAVLQAKFESLKTIGSPEARSIGLGFASSTGQLGPDDGPFPAAPIKFVLFPQHHVRKFRPYLPYLAELRGKLAFEIGVGPGYLFLLLKEVFGVNLVGIDVGIEEQLVYRELRRRLRIDDAVFEHRVEAEKDIPIPDGAEAVLAFWPVYERHWSLKEHKWFLDHCASKLRGRRLVALRFNKGGYRDAPEIREFYEAKGVFPFGKSKDFCLLTFD
jgi:hypothetical protein